MALTLVNNNYVGDLVGQLATLLTVGSTDLGLFDFLLTNGFKVRFPYATVNTVIDSFTSQCNITDNSSREREIVDVELITLVVQETACYDEEFRTDYSNATAGYESQNLAAMISEWVRLHVDNFSFGLQSLRWAGDSALVSTDPLSKHDGVVKLVQAKGAYDATTNTKGYQQITTGTVDETNALDSIANVAEGVEQIWVRAHSGYKIIVSPKVANALVKQIRANNHATGRTALPTVNIKASAIGAPICDSTYFGAPVYVAQGLAASTATENAILAGVFEGSRLGVLKCAVLRTQDVGKNPTISIREVNDGDAVRFRGISAQNIAVIPDLSQMAANF